MIEIKNENRTECCNAKKGKKHRFVLFVCMIFCSYLLCQKECHVIYKANYNSVTMCSSVHDSFCSKSQPNRNKIEEFAICSLYKSHIFNYANIHPLYLNDNFCFYSVNYYLKIFALCQHNITCIYISFTFSLSLFQFIYLLFSHSLNGGNQ